MSNIKKYIACLAVCIAFAMNMAITAGAAEDDEEISKVTLTVTADTSEGTSGSLDVTADDSRYQIESFDFIGGSGDWKPGDIPKVKVILNAEEGYSFGTRMTAGRVTVKNNGNCTSVKRVERGASLEVTIQLKAIPGTLGAIEDAFWVEYPIGKAKWDEAKLASAYQVKLYYKDTVIKTVDKTTVNTFDFYSYMTKAGTYYFKVRAVPRNTSESTYMDTGEWVNSDELYIESGKTAHHTGQSPDNSDYIPSAPLLGTSTGQLGPASAGASSPGGMVSNAGWVKDGKGWQYRDAGGAFLTNDWALIDGKWYLFNIAGYMEIGWQIRKDKYYYLTVNGDMLTGWVEDNKRWYYLGSDGAMMTGWIQDSGQWYYSNPDGTRAVGWTNINKKWYYFNQESGIMMKDTVIEGRHVDGNGVWNG